MRSASMALRAALFAAASAYAAGEVAAQDVSLSSAVEAGGDEVYLIFSELSAVAGGEGWRPVGSLAAYMVFTEGDDSWGVTPAVGLRYRAPGGFLQGKVGWAFRDEGGTPFFGGDDSGVHTSAHAEYWGDGTWSAQGIASYNWGSDYLWSRARLARRVATLDGGGAVALGGELVWQADTDDQLVQGVEVEGYEATQIGPVLQWVTSADGAVVSFSGGWKNNSVADFEEDTWYVKAELHLPFR